MPELPADLIEAFSDGGEPTVEQVRRLMKLEAEAMGMTFDEALEALHEDKLPHTPVGIDFRYLADELAFAVV
jgi:hypothetical protein